jgi:ABC-type sugar transport system substrate-binding protein
MKKTKMILAAALMMVAVGGAFASKAKIAETYYYTNDGVNYLPYSTEEACPSDGDNCIQTIPGVGPRLLFRQSGSTFISLQHA